MPDILQGWTVTITGNTAIYALFCMALVTLQSILFIVDRQLQLYRKRRKRRKGRYNGR